MKSRSRQSCHFPNLYQLLHHQLLRHHRLFIANPHQVISRGQTVEAQTVHAGGEGSLEDGAAGEVDNLAEGRGAVGVGCDKAMVGSRIRIDGEEGLLRGGEIVHTHGGESLEDSLIGIDLARTEAQRAGNFRVLILIGRLQQDFLDLRGGKVGVCL